MKRKAAMNSNTTSITTIPSVVYNGAKSEQFVYLSSSEPLTDTEVTDTEQETPSFNDNSHQFEEHKNQILHVLPELKIGMDLSKVKTPSFLFERRSLLEVFADCMLAHSDLFIRVDDCDTAEDRMLAVLDWYLTSFNQINQVSLLLVQFIILFLYF